MIRSKRKIRVATFLASLMIAGLLQAMLGSMLSVRATEKNAPSVTAYATKSELMNTFQQDGNNTAIGKLMFGKDSSGKPLEWYILGSDNGVKGDNISIFAASPITTAQVFESEGSVVKDFCERDGVYTVNPSQLNPNHYGASDFRVALQGLATNTSYFTTGEQSLMQATTITNYDTFNKVEYFTTDVLYALKGDDSGDTRLWAGSNNDKILPRSIYWNDGESFWLRPPNNNTYVSAFSVDPSYAMVRSICVDNESAVRPASNLNLSAVLFASAVKAATSDTAVSGTIAEDVAMTLRLDGSNKFIGNVVYDSTEGILVANKSSSVTGTVALVMQGNDGVNDWYYSKVITGKELIRSSDISAALKLSSEPDLSDCEIWIETTIDGMTYAINAVSSDDNLKTSDDGKDTYYLNVFDAAKGTVTYVAPMNKKQPTVKIPDIVLIDGIVYKVIAIEKDAFKKNKYVKTVTIGKNVTTIGANAFCNCTKLENVKFGSNVTTIGEKAFYKCTALRKISIPRMVKSIGEKAFYGCCNVKTLTIKSIKLTTKKIGSKAFSKTSRNMTVKVPKKKFKVYKSMLIKKGVNKKAKFKKI